MRTKKEEDDFNLSLKIIKQYKQIPARVQSNSYTRKYIKYISIYSKNKDQRDLLVKNDILSSGLRGKKGPERLIFMEGFREEWLKAVKRSDDARVKRYNEWMEEERIKASAKRVRENRMAAGQKVGREPIGVVSKKVEKKASPIIIRARNHILRIIDTIIQNINDGDENPLLIGETDNNIIEYIQTELDDDVERELKTPKLVYSKEMWKTEADKSLTRLKNTDFLSLQDYVTKTKRRTFNKGRTPTFEQETEYQRDFMVIKDDNTAVYPVPSSEELFTKSVDFDPRRAVSYTHLRAHET